MIVVAPASRAPAMAALPTPPHPNTATLSPRPTSPVYIAAPRPAITPQPSRPGGLGLARRVRPWWPGRRRRASSPRTRRCRARALSSVPSASVIFCVALRVAKQYHGRPRRQARHAPHTARQLRIDEVAGRDLGDVGPDRLDHARRLVAEQEREVVVDRALPVVQVGVAHAARLHRHERLARARVGHDDRLDLDRRALRERDHTLHRRCSHGVCLAHCSIPPPARMAAVSRSGAGARRLRATGVAGGLRRPQRLRVAHRRARSTSWPTPRTGSVVPTRPSPPTSAPTSCTSPTATVVVPRSPPS